MSEWIDEENTVTRMLAGEIPMRLKVSEVTEDRIICGPWEFNKETGHEVDDEISCLVSHLVLPEPPKEE